VLKCCNSNPIHLLINMFKLVTFLTLFHVATAHKHCPLQKSLCPTLCKHFEKEVPRPTLFNYCIQGCELAQENGSNADCNKHCIHTDLPRPTTTDSCKSGCNIALSEINRCNVILANRASKNDEL
jgi:hypothetical protein